MAKAIVIHETGGPEVLKYEDVDVPEPGPGEVRIRHRAIGVNFIDTYKRSGMYPMKLPAIPGDEGVGVVDAVGEGVEEFRPGDRVGYGALAQGSYAQVRVAPASELVAIPEAVGDEQAAAGLLRGLTVEYLVRRLHRIVPDETILVHAAAGGLGIILCQWAKLLGARVIGTVSSAGKAEVARAKGCDHVIVYTEADFVEAVKELTAGRLVDVVYDSIGRDTFSKSLQCIRPRGLMVAYGNASGKPEPFDVLDLARYGSLFLTRPTLYYYTRERQELVEAARALFEVVASGAVTMPVGKTFPLEAAADAHRYLMDRNRTGAPILIP